MKLFWKTLLKSQYFRKSIITHIRADYFNEIDLSIKIKNGYWAQILNHDALDSFSEIFIENEYLEFLPETEIKKIIDIGANYGYFTIWLQSMSPNIELESLMIEPCINCHDSIDGLMKDQKSKGISHILDGVIADPKLEHSSFLDRPFMASSSFVTPEEQEEVRKVRIITEDEIISKLSPPYDLIKCDIEGSEWEFLSHYPKILSGTKHLILEWHSWHDGGGSKDQIIESLKQMHFSIVNSSVPSPATGRKGQVGLILAENESIAN